MPRYDFDIAVFAANEASTIVECIASLDRACQGRRAHITCLFNGTSDSSLSILKELDFLNADFSAYQFSVADKTNAINHFLYDLRQDADIYFGLDGYVRINPSGLEAMKDSLFKNPDANAASGIPITGRSLKQLGTKILRGGVLVGGFYALSSSFVNRIVSHGYKLPRQLYRGDGLLGSMAAHDLDALGLPWENRRIIGVSHAKFSVRPLSPFRVRDLVRQFNREIRQARGMMENEAIKSIIYEGGYGALPDNANQMLRMWLSRNEARPRSMREVFFTRLALRQLARAADIEPVSPALLYKATASTTQRGRQSHTVRATSK